MKTTIATGGTGVAATAGGWFLSHMAELTSFLQIFSLLVGIAVGVVTLYKLVTRGVK